MFSIGDTVTIHTGGQKVPYWFKGGKTDEEGTIIKDGTAGVVKDKVKGKTTCVVEYPFPENTSKLVLSYIAEKYLQKK